MTSARKQLVRYLYDTQPNLTLQQLSRMTGVSVAQLKLILMGN
jgi:hypothetical protein